MRSFVLLCAVAVCFSSCQQEQEKPQTVKQFSFKGRPNKYASRFEIGELSNGQISYKTIYLRGNRSGKEATTTFILYPKSQPRPDIVKGACYIATPVEHVASLGSVYTTMLCKMGLRQNIVAIENVDYYNNPYIVEQVKLGRVQELSKGPEIDAERTIALHPDLVFTFGMGNAASDAGSRITQAGIPVAVSIDHLEETPLARAEWIKFYGAFFDKDQVADSLFNASDQHYRQLLALTDTVAHRPTVLTEMKYGDAWYVPGGDSYVAHLLRDAGADYLWKDEHRTGSLPLSFEAVLLKARDGDFWLNLFMVNSKKELLGYDERYSLFKAFKQGHLYNNNRLQNSKGYSEYWETGICSPDELLADLISIFHPGLLPGHKLTYYKPIE